MTHQISFPDLGIYLKVPRAAFSFFEISIYWYGLLIGTGLILAVLYGLRRAKKVGISQDDVLNMVLLAVPVAVIFARLYYVIFRWEYYRDDLLSILDIRSGGLAIYGGVIGACLVVFLYCKRKKISIGKVLDLLAIGLLIGQAIGRWGNFTNGEAFGTTTSLPWAMTIETMFGVVAERVHPTFLYESLWNGIGILLLLQYRRHGSFDGELFCGYLVWYGLGRFWIEGLRADSLYLGPLRVSQVLAAVTMLLGLGWIVWKRRKTRKE